MESKGKPIGGAQGKPQPEGEKRETYTASYMAAGQSRAKEPSITKIPSRGGGWWLLLLLVAGGVACFLWRDALVPWLRQNSLTSPLVAVVEEQLGVTKSPKKGQLPGEVRNDTSDATGGEVTFTGKGVGTVTPDDGSDSFRVVVPPEPGKK